jgi:hypothetical protein
MMKQILYDYPETYDYFLNDLPNGCCSHNEMISLSEEEDFQRAKDEIYYLNHSSNSNEKQTSYITNKTEFHYEKKINSPSPKNKAIYEHKLLDNCCSFEQIQKILAENENKFKDINQKFSKNYYNVSSNHPIMHQLLVQ